MKVLLADDHPLMREGVRHVLDKLAENVSIVDAGDFPGLFAMAAMHPDLDLALVDLNMPGLPGIEGMAQFRSRFPAIPLVVLSASESRHDIQRVLDLGAAGYIPKASPPAIMRNALDLVLAGGVYVPPVMLAPDSGLAGHEAEAFAALRHTGLTTRQMEVLRLLVQGCPNKVIARHLDLTEGTVKIHVTAIFRALGVNNRTEAALAVRRLGIDLEPRSPPPG
jgi:DNA-binding NarL/FixJ family response regulator